ncbi:glycerol-3-phosphate 1-O-acyltransferase PlsY [Gammaproteobacteria bacterium]|nr:glycerol-3-phosphate 1-O-acyltransferase PlsY [Gammaproteobacteria bacterium]
MRALLSIIIAYLLGSISSAIPISRLFGLDDPRGYGSGNPGATNVLRSGSKAAAILTLLGDFLKGVLAILIARAMGAGDWGIAMSGLAVFSGHLFPVFFGFRGGKGVATAAGVYFALSPVIGLALLVIWFACAWLTRYSSLSALLAAAGAVVATLVTMGPIYGAMAMAMAALLVWSHRENIRRLRDGSESKISFGKKSDG